MRKISIVIPAYNEEKRIEKTLVAYSNFFNDLFKKGEIDYEILIVINNTTDDTLKIVKAYSEGNKKMRYLNLVKGGKGYAVMEGFKNALKRDNDFIGFVDADMATSPVEFYKLTTVIGRYGGAIASRYMEGSVIDPKPTIGRLIAKRMFNSCVRAVLFLPYKDTQCGAKVFQRIVIEKVSPIVTMSQWAFDVDLLYSARKEGYKIIEVPTRWSDMAYAKINFWKAGPKMVLGVLRLRILNSPLRRLIGLYEKSKSLIEPTGLR